MIQRLRAKFVCINMALVMTMLLIILMAVYHFTAVNLENNSMAALREALSGPMGMSRPGMRGQPCFTIQETPDGKLLAEGGSYYDLTDEQFLRQLYALAGKQPADAGVLEDYVLRYYREQGKFGTRYAFADMSAEQEVLRGLAQVGALIFAVGFAAFLCVSIGLARWAIHPVERAWEQQKQFVADASHELKTPLTVILTNAELLQLPEYSPEEKDRFAGAILDVSRQMRTLVENLLQLARADRDRRKIQYSRLDFSVLTESAVLPFEAVYFEQGMTLESQVQPGLHVCADAAALRQVVDILLDNGSKYGAAGGAARLTLNRQGKRVQLRFFTPGVPLTTRQCADIFKRFYRVDEARTPSGSYGLGLSIAQNIVETHGGRIWAEGTKEGNVFTVSIPEG